MPVEEGEEEGEEGDPAGSECGSESDSLFDTPLDMSDGMPPHKILGVVEFRDQASYMCDMTRAQVKEKLPDLKDNLEALHPAIAQSLNMPIVDFH